MESDGELIANAKIIYSEYRKATRMEPENTYFQPFMQNEAVSQANLNGKVMQSVGVLQIYQNSGKIRSNIS